MNKVVSAMHVDTIKRRHGEREYQSQLVRRSIREGKRVRKETVANISKLPPAAIAALKRVLAGETLLPVGEAFRIERSLPHGHVACVLGTLRKLGLERILARERTRERDLAVAMICQRLLRPGPPRRYLEPGGFVLYDLSSSYLEGSHCPLAAFGYPRDGKRGKLQITYGLS